MNKLAALTVLAFLAIPSTALAGRAEVVDGQFRYTGAPGERNGAILTKEGDEYHVVDNLPGGAFPEAGPGCRTSNAPFNSNHGVYCPAAGVTSVAIGLGDGDDGLSVENPVPVPVFYSGGDGADYVIYRVDGPGVTISADGLADDGPAGRDNVQPDVEQLFGTFTADTLAAGAADSTLRGGSGDDTMAGGPGDDVIRAASIEDVGLELGDFDAGGADRVSCGHGYDYVLADLGDLLAADCEQVAVNRRKGKYGYELRGSARGEALRPREFFEGPIRILGLRGNDRITSSTDDGMWGGPGNDVLKGRTAQSRERNVFDGGKGQDRIYSRDDSADTVRCGPGRRDRAYADRSDRVARDCERVSRRGRGAGAS